VSPENIMLLISKDGFVKDFGSRARQLRQGASMTLQQVAKQACERGHQLSLSHLSQLERGITPWSDSNLQAVADGLGVSFRFLIAGL